MKEVKVIIDGKEYKAEMSEDTINEICGKEYPRYFLSLRDKFVVRFNSLQVGEVVVGDTNKTCKVGYKPSGWKPHTDTDTWKEVIYDEEAGLYDGQPVMCKRSIDTHAWISKFYDAKNKNTFTYYNKRDGGGYDSIKAIPTHHVPDEMWEAQETLEDW